MAFMWRKVAVMEASRNASNSELDSLISRFIEEHTTSEDTCPPKLLEAKHQLNQLHKEILDLADLVNNTEAAVEKHQKDLKDAQDELREIDDHCQNQSDALDPKREANRKMLAKLRSEMGEMKAIAQPQVTMNFTNQSLENFGNRSVTPRWQPLAFVQKDAQPSRG